MKVFGFDELRDADLVVDAVYMGGRRGNSSDDVLNRLMQVSNQGGFRYLGNLKNLKMLLVSTNRSDLDWPDELDPETGVFTYFGDNKKPGRRLHDTPRNGNNLLRTVFELSQDGPDGRASVPPIFLFANTGNYRDVTFLGLAVPGISSRVDEDLVAIWRTSDGQRFQNYRARFSVLDCAHISRAWLTHVIAGNPLIDAPKVWLDWIKTGRPRVLRAPRPVEYRSKAEQLPETREDHLLVDTVRAHFAKSAHAFEHCAAEIARMMLGRVSSIDVTRPSRDGGRDAVGLLSVGDGPASILVDFALEAKCYGLGSPVGVKELSRLISRLRHRQFGVLVTTSYVALQAYQEIKEDRHPIVVIAAKDIATVLRRNGLGSVQAVKGWLEAEFPIQPIRQIGNPPPRNAS